MNAKWSQAMLQQMEKSVGALTDTLARSEAVLGAAGKVLETSGVLRMVVDRTIERALSAWRVPTRTDIEDLLKSVAGVDRRADDIGERLAEIGQAGHGHGPDGGPGEAPGRERSAEETQRLAQETQRLAQKNQT